MNDELLVTVVVVAYHRAGAIDRLVRQLRSSSVHLVVVNVECDVEVRAAARGTDILELARNEGYATGVNEGVKRARGDVVVFMNDDVVVDAEDVLCLASALRGSDAGVVVPRLLTTVGDSQPTIMALPTPGALLREWALFPDRPPSRAPRWLRLEKWRRPGAPERIQAATAAIVAARRDLLERHALPEDYFLYWEEAEWFWRLRDAGIAVEFRPECVASHEGGRDELGPGKSALLARNAVRCVRRTQGRFSGLLAYVIVVAWQLRLVATAALRRVVGRPLAENELRSRAAGLRAGLMSFRELA